MKDWLILLGRRRASAFVVRADLDRYGATAADRQLLVFAAFEAKAAGAAEIDNPHLFLAALRQDRTLFESHRAEEERLRREIRSGGEVQMPLGLSTRAKALLERARTPAEIIESA